MHWIVLTAGLLLSLLVAMTVERVVQERAVERFRLQGDEVRNMLARRLDKYELALRGGVALFHASQSVERADWQLFVTTLDIPHTLPGVQGVGYSQVIAPADLAAHEQAIQAEGFPQYRVKPAGERPLYTSIVLLEPFD